MGMASAHQTADFLFDSGKLALVQMQDQPQPFLWKAQHHFRLSMCFGQPGEDRLLDIPGQLLFHTLGELDA